MNRRILAPVIATSLALGACGGGDENFPQEVINVATEYTDAYGCGVDDEIIFSSDELIDSQGLNQSIQVAKAESGKITFNDSVGQELWKKVAAHEMAHACVNNSVEVVFDNQIPIYAFGEIAVSSEGFSIKLASGDYISAIDEGIAEWLVEPLEGVISSDDSSYDASRILTGKLMDYRGLDRKSIAKLQQNNDLIALIALLKDKAHENVNEYDVNDVLSLYYQSFGYGVVPLDEEIDFILNYNTDF